MEAQIDLPENVEAFITEASGHAVDELDVRDEDSVPFVYVGGRSNGGQDTDVIEELAEVHGGEYDLATVGAYNEWSVIFR